MNSELDFSLAGKPDFTYLTVRLAAGEQMFAEPSAMMSMSPTVALKSSLKGGVFSSIKRAFGGESLVMNTFTATQAGEVLFAPGTMGDMVHYHLDGLGIKLQRGAFVAHGKGVELSSSWQGAKGFFSGEGLVLLKATGAGDLFFNSYGSIIEIDVNQDYFVDTGYVVAFEDTLDYRVTTLPGLGIGGRVKSFFFGGEGLVCRFSGVGKVWIQTRSVSPFVNWVHPFRPVEDKNRDYDD